MTSSPVYTPEYGFLPAPAARLADVLHDYNPYIQLVFIPPRDRSETDVYPYALQDTSPWRPPNIIKHLTEREVEDPASVLAWLFEGDLSKHSLVDIMDRVKLKEQAERLVKIQEEEDRRQERIELSAALIQGGIDKKHFYRHNGKTFRR